MAAAEAGSAWKQPGCLEVLKEEGILFILWDVFFGYEGQNKGKLGLMSSDETSGFVKQQYISARLCSERLGNYFAPLWRDVRGTVLGRLFLLIQPLSLGFGLSPLTLRLGNPALISLGCCLLRRQRMWPTMANEA